MVVAGDTAEVSHQTVKDAAEGLLTNPELSQESCTPEAGRTPPLVESSLECEAHSPWNVRETTVPTWRNTGPPEKPHGCLCVETVYLTGLGLCEDLTLARAVVCVLGVGWGWYCWASLAFFRVRPPPLLITP